MDLGLNIVSPVPSRTIVSIRQHKGTLFAHTICLGRAILEHYAFVVRAVCRSQNTVQVTDIGAYLSRSDTRESLCEFRGIKIMKFPFMII